MIALVQKMSKASQLHRLQSRSLRSAVLASAILIDNREHLPPQNGSDWPGVTESPLLQPQPRKARLLQVIAKRLSGTSLLHLRSRLDRNLWQDLAANSQVSPSARWMALSTLNMSIVPSRANRRELRRPLVKEYQEMQIVDFRRQTKRWQKFELGNEMLSPRPLKLQKIGVVLH